MSQVQQNYRKNFRDSSQIELDFKINDNQKEKLNLFGSFAIEEDYFPLDMILTTQDFNISPFSKIGKNKLFYDVIYNPQETNFLRKGKELGNKTENGKLMFMYQALEAFKIWHKIEPKISNDTLKFLDND